MPKFSVIIIDNDENENITRCINSAYNQTYDDYEIILIANCSLDEHKKIIKKAINESKINIKVMYVKEMNIFEMRKKAIQKCNGDYIVFINSSDFIEPDLLKTLSKKIKDEPDIIRFQMKDIFDDKIIMCRELPFETVKGETAFKKICKYHHMNKFNIYSYKTSFLKEDSKQIFKKLDEDFVFLPSLLILQANKVKSIGFIGYNLTDNAEYNLNEQLRHYKMLVSNLKFLNLSGMNSWKNYMSNKLVKKSTSLKSKQYKNYIFHLKQYEIFGDLNEKGIKKVLVNKFPKIYYKLYRNK